jgi:hypothetical protein
MFKVSSSKVLLQDSATVPNRLVRFYPGDLDRVRRGSPVKVQHCGPRAIYHLCDYRADIETARNIHSSI